ncbi:MAG: hypothetical protein ACLUD2_17610 [Clostridium sp.]
MKPVAAKTHVAYAAAGQSVFRYDPGKSPCWLPLMQMIFLCWQHWKKQTVLLSVPRVRGWIPMWEMPEALYPWTAPEDGHCPGAAPRAEYMIFDEATSSVDPQSEKEIWETIGHLAESRTLIIISHRMSSVQNADCIYVLRWQGGPAWDS